MEFLLYTREQLVDFEDNFSKGMPGTMKDYLATVSKTLEEAGAKEEMEELKQLISNEQADHFKKWFWTLLYCSELKCKSLTALRKSLNNSVKEYFWFAKQIYLVFKVFNKSVHGQSSLGVKFMKKEKFPEYASFFAKDPSSAILMFFKTVY